MLQCASAHAGTGLLTRFFLARSAPAIFRCLVLFAGMESPDLRGELSSPLIRSSLRIDRQVHITVVSGYRSDEAGNADDFLILMGAVPV